MNHNLYLDMKRQIVLFLSLALIFVSCQNNDQLQNKIDSSLLKVKNKFAKDTRITIHSVSAKVENNSIILFGETEHKDSKKEIINSLKYLNLKIYDSIKFLPKIENINSIGIIRISVANIRSNPEESAELSTQVLMGMPIVIRKISDDWFYVQTNEKYLGWLSDDSFVQLSPLALERWNKQKKFFITSLFEIIREEPNEKSFPVSDVVAGSIVAIKNYFGKWVFVELPDGRTGYLPINSGKLFDEWKLNTIANASSIESVAKSLIGMPYLWGGTSIKGMDCSGFTKTVYMLNGIQLSRDANQQALEGNEIKTDTNFSQLRKGDLLFFGRKANKDKPEKIIHVGIYLDSGNVIHASGLVKINNLSPQADNYSERLRKTFICAKRILPEKLNILEVQKN